MGSDEQKAKVSKSEKRNSAGKTSTNGSKDEPNHGDFSTIGLEKKLEEQSKLLWDIKDQLNIHVTTAELREMLEANGQDSTGSEYDLRDRWLVFISLSAISSYFVGSVSCYVSVFK